MADDVKQVKTDDSLPAEDKVHVVNRDVVGPKKFTFRRVAPAGYHEGEVPDRDASGKLILDPVMEGGKPRVTDEGKPVKRIRTHVVKYGRGRADGDIVETNEDLTRHNVKGFPPVFERVDKDANPDADRLADYRKRQGALVESRRRLMSGMSVEQLREYAESEGIDVARLTKKEQMLRAIEAAQADLVAA
jgi:hypothetical protein